MANHSNKTKKKNAPDQHNESPKTKPSTPKSNEPEFITPDNGSPKTNNDEDDISFSWLTLNPEQFLDILMQNLSKFWLQMCRLASFVMTELGGYQLFETIALWCARNPHLALFLLAASIVCLLPFLIIFGFGIATMVMAFTGLLMLEGTLLTIISVMFVACLGGLAIILPLVGIVTLAGYFGLAKIYSFYGADIERKRNALISMVDESFKTYTTGQQAKNVKIINKEEIYES